MSAQERRWFRLAPTFVAAAALVWGLSGCPLDPPDPDPPPPPTATPTPASDPAIVWVESAGFGVPWIR